LLLPLGTAAFLVACGGGEDNSPAGAPSGVGPDQPSTAVASSTVPARTPSGAAATPAASTTGVSTKLNLNTASGADYQKAIPNFPSNMVREFLEYRPYVSIQQFRKELGKYVSASQVAEWEKYVYVPVDANNSDAETLKQLPGVTDSIAGQLASARPYSSSDAFLSKLATLTSQANASAAKPMLKS
jgi:DNA uptake protein ComE-like DNA-binding protein